MDGDGGLGASVEDAVDVAGSEVERRAGLRRAGDRGVDGSAEDEALLADAAGDDGDGDGAAAFLTNLTFARTSMLPSAERAGGDFVLLQVVVADVVWAPLLLTPVALVGWFLLFRLWVRSTEHPGSVKRAARGLRFRLGARWRRRRRMREALARENLRSGKADLTQLVGDEHLTWASLWMVEVYLTAHGEDLRNGLERVGWCGSERGGVQDVGEWLREVRAKGALSWIRPGYFRPQRSRSFPSATALDLPPAFSHLDPVLVQLGPGVTVLVANFGLAEDEQGCLERALRAPAEARVEPLRNGHRLFRSEQVRAERVAEARQRVRAIAAEWIKERFPGAFSSRGVEPPSWDLLITEQESLVRGLSGKVSWQDAVGMLGAGEWDYASRDTPARLGEPSPGLNTSKAVPSFFGRRQELVDSLGPGRGDSIFSVAQELDENIQSLLAVWACVRTAESYDQALSLARDRKLPARATYRATSAQLERLRESVLPAARDLKILKGLAALLGEERSKGWLGNNTYDLTMTIAAGGEVSILEWLIKRLAVESAEVERRVEDDSSSLQAYSETLVAASNLRLQMVVLVLSVLVAALTVVTVILAIED